MTKPVLVTGADGFIGSHLVEALAQERPVRAFVQYNVRGSIGWLEQTSAATMKSVEVVAGDVRDQACVKAAMRGCGGVLHLAALIGIPYSYVAPESYIDTNIKGTLSILQAARELEIPRVVVTSTSEVYGTAKYVPIDEDHPLLGQSPYSASKIGADQLAISFHRSFGLPVVIARPFNTYGPRQSARAIIPTVITQIAAGKREVRVGATQPTRDFSFVSDTAAGMRACLDGEGAVGEVINFGSGFEISIADTIDAIAMAMNAKVTIVSDTARVRPRDSEVERLWADNGKASRLLRWQPAYGGRDGFLRGLAATAAWFSDPTNLRHYRPGEYAI